MKLVVFGLAVSSSWGNGHATLWRGLARALHGRGHRLVFFERDQPFYAVHRERPFFKDLTRYMSSGPVVVQVLEGENAVAKNRV